MGESAIIILMRHSKKLCPMSNRTLERFLGKIVVSATECWEWTGALTRRGYAQFSIYNAVNYGHRLAYTHWVGQIPDGLELDHLCFNRRCVNPDHLEPVTTQTNIQREFDYERRTQTRRFGPKIIKQIG